MTILSRFFGSKPRRRGRRPLACEALEGRALLSIGGISLQYSNLQVVAPLNSGNTFQLSVDPANHNIKVSLDGQTEEFAPSQVSSVTFKGGAGGHDSFINNTPLVEYVQVYGGNNTVVNGTTYNYIEAYGNDNVFDFVAGSTSDVWEHGGTGDVVNNPSNAFLQVYA